MVQVKCIMLSFHHGFTEIFHHLPLAARLETAVAGKLAMADRYQREFCRNGRKGKGPALKQPRDIASERNSVLRV